MSAFGPTPPPLCADVLYVWSLELTLGTNRSVQKMFASSTSNHACTSRSTRGRVSYPQSAAELGAKNRWSGEWRRDRLHLLLGFGGAEVIDDAVQEDGQVQLHVQHQEHAADGVLLRL